jgi:hypothetical protein
MKSLLASLKTPLLKVVPKVLIQKVTISAYSKVYKIPLLIV